VRTTSVENGRSTHVSSLNVDGAAVPSTAVKTVKRVHGCTTGIGV